MSQSTTPTILEQNNTEIEIQDGIREIKEIKEDVKEIKEVKETKEKETTEQNDNEIIELNKDDNKEINLKSKR